MVKFKFLDKAKHFRRQFFFCNHHSRLQIYM